MGITLALLCAVVWSISIIMFKLWGERMSVINLNIFKNVIATLLFAATTWLVEGQLFSGLSDRIWWIVIFSGSVGIGLADILILQGLRYISATRLAVLECLFSPFVVLLAALFLGEELTWSEGFGGAVIAFAIYLVLSGGAGEPVPAGPSRVRLGSSLVVVGIFVTAVGIVMMKPVLSEGSLFEILMIRLLAGAAGSVLFGACLGGVSFRELGQACRDWRILTVSVLSTYIAIILWLGGYKYLPAAITAILNQTSTVFTVVFAAWILRERLTARRIVAVFLATLGVVSIVV